MALRLRTVLAVIAAGVFGTLASAATAALGVEGAQFMALLTSPLRFAVDMGCAALLPVIAARVRGVLQGVASLLALILIPTLLATVALTIDASPELVLSINAVYAGVALLAYRLVMVGGE